VKTHSVCDMLMIIVDDVLIIFLGDMLMFIVGHMLMIISREYCLFYRALLQKRPMI